MIISPSRATAAVRQNPAYTTFSGAFKDFRYLRHNQPHRVAHNCINCNRSYLAPRERLDGLRQSVVREFGIAHRRADVGVSEGLLYRLNVPGVAHQLRAEGVAEAMRDAVHHPGFPPPDPGQPLDGPAMHRPALAVLEQEGLSLAVRPLGDVGAQRGHERTSWRRPLDAVSSSSLTSSGVKRRTVSTWAFAASRRRWDSYPTTVSLLLLSPHDPVRSDDREQEVSGEHALALHGIGGRVRFAASDHAHFLVLSGAEIREPLLLDGSSIMNERADRGGPRAVPRGHDGAPGAALGDLSAIQGEAGAH